MDSRVLCLFLGLSAVPGVSAQDFAGPAANLSQVEHAGGADESAHRPPRMDVVTADQWANIDASIDRALAWLATQQASDGSFATKASGQPAVTSLCVVAYLSSGHNPGQGRFGETLNRAIDFVLTTQREDGLFSLEATTLPADVWNEATHTATYNHAIAGLMLGEVYGQTDSARSQRVRPAIERGLVYTRQMQLRRKRSPIDEWGWRYIKDVPTSSGGSGGDADMSATSWHIMFLRSARNAGFDVPVADVNEALDFVRRCYRPNEGSFGYALYANGRMPTRATTGAGVLSLFLSGKYDPQIAAGAGRWILAHPFDRYNGSMHATDRYFYSAYYCSQAAFQLGGRYWEEFYPPLANVLLAHQRSDGGWDAEAQDPEFGAAYSTALAVLCLTPPYQLLPIYQR
jgi:hypothetical protein